MWVFTCLECQYVSLSTRADNTVCPKCRGSRIFTETPSQRDIRLNISSKNIRSFDVKDQLKGIRI